MPFSASRSKPIARSVERQTGTLRSFVYVASSGESRRIHAMWAEEGTSSRSSPSRRSSQRSREGSNVVVPSTRAVSTASAIGRSGTPLVGLVARNGVVDPRHRRLELVARREQRASLVVEARRDLEHCGAEPVPATVVGLGREPCLGGSQGKLLAVPWEPGRRGGRSRARPRARRARGRRAPPGTRGGDARWTPARLRSRPPLLREAPSSWSRVKRSAYRATIAACSEVSFSPTRTARASSERSIPYCSSRLRTRRPGARSRGHLRAACPSRSRARSRPSSSSDS